MILHNMVDKEKFKDATLRLALYPWDARSTEVDMWWHELDDLPEVDRHRGYFLDNGEQMYEYDTMRLFLQKWL
jgi:hypothetical protein